jgi:hypothetical protein
MATRYTLASDPAQEITMQSLPLIPAGAEDATALLWSETVTRYDVAHLFLYAHLLDAEAAGTSRRQMMEDILGLDAGRAAAEIQLTLHLNRAHWMRSTGYSLLLSEDNGGVHG